MRNGEDSRAASRVERVKGGLQLYYQRGSPLHKHGNSTQIGWKVLRFGGLAMTMHFNRLSGDIQLETQVVAIEMNHLHRLPASDLIMGTYESG